MTVTVPSSDDLRARIAVLAQAVQRDPDPLIASGIIIDSLGRRWNPALHPRDRHGRFIETFAEIRAFLKKGSQRADFTGRVIAIDRDNTAVVQIRGGRGQYANLRDQLVRVPIDKTEAVEYKARIGQDPPKALAPERRSSIDAFVKRIRAKGTRVKDFTRSTDPVDQLQDLERLAEAAEKAELPTERDRLLDLKGEIRGEPRNDVILDQAKAILPDAQEGGDADAVRAEPERGEGEPPQPGSRQERRRALRQRGRDAGADGSLWSERAGREVPEGIRPDLIKRGFSVADEEFAAEYRELTGQDPRDFFELDAAGAEDFARAINEAKENSPFGAYVTAYDTPYYADGDNVRLFLADGGKAGFAVKNGEIVSVFSDPSERGMADLMLPLAIQNGGRYLDAFNNDDNGLGKLYGDFGFEPVAKMPFDPEFAPDDWWLEEDGTPDVLFMGLDVDNPADGFAPDGIPEIDDYDEGQRLAKAKGGITDDDERKAVLPSGESPGGDGEGSGEGRPGPDLLIPEYDPDARKPLFDEELDREPGPGTRPRRPGTVPPGGEREPRTVPRPSSERGREDGGGGVSAGQLPDQVEVDFDDLGRRVDAERQKMEDFLPRASKVVLRNPRDRVRLDETPTERRDYQVEAYERHLDRLDDSYDALVEAKRNADSLRDELLLKDDLTRGDIRELETAERRVRQARDRVENGIAGTRTRMNAVRTALAQGAPEEMGEFFNVMARALWRDIKSLFERRRQRPARVAPGADESTIKSRLDGLPTPEGEGAREAIAVEVNPDGSLSFTGGEIKPAAAQAPLAPLPPSSLDGWNDVDPKTWAQEFSQNRLREFAPRVGKIRGGDLDIIADQLGARDRPYRVLRKGDTTFVLDYPVDDATLANAARIMDKLAARDSLDGPKNVRFTSFDPATGNVADSIPGGNMMRVDLNAVANVKKTARPGHFKGAFYGGDDDLEYIMTHEYGHMRGTASERKRLQVTADVVTTVAKEEGLTLKQVQDMMGSYELMAINKQQARKLGYPAAAEFFAENYAEWMMTDGNTTDPVARVFARLEGLDKPESERPKPVRLPEGVREVPPSNENTNDAIYRFAAASDVNTAAEGAEFFRVRYPEANVNGAIDRALKLGGERDGASPEEIRNRLLEANRVVRDEEDPRRRAALKNIFMLLDPDYAAEEDRINAVYDELLPRWDIGDYYDDVEGAWDFLGSAADQRAAYAMLSDMGAPRDLLDRAFPLAAGLDPERGRPPAQGCLACCCAARGLRPGHLRVRPLHGRSTQGPEGQACRCRAVPEQGAPGRCRERRRPQRRERDARPDV